MPILQLANESRETIIDLLGGAFALGSGFNAGTPDIGGLFTYEPYGAQFDPSNFEPKTEIFNITIQGRSASVIAEAQRLQNFLESIRLYSDNDIAIESSWLEWSACDEDPKRSLLYSGRFDVTSHDNVTPNLYERAIEGVLTLTRHPLWENLATYEIDTVSKSNLGGQFNYTGVTGNTLARIAETTLTTLAAGTHWRFWVGIRRFNRGVTGFVPVWECEDSAPGTWDADTGLKADVAPVGGVNDASPIGLGNDSLTTTFAARQDLIERFHINIVDVAGADYDHFQGRYLVLLRCRVVGAGGVAGVQMGYGYEVESANLAEEVYIDNTSWQLIPLGNISIPPWRGPLAANRYYLGCGIFIFAEQLVACSLDFDCLVLIPNEHLLQVEGFDVDPAGLGTSDRINVRENDTEWCRGETPISVTDTPSFVMTDWYCPPGSGMVIVAAEDETVHTLGINIRVVMDTYSRWTLYRGS